MTDAATMPTGKRHSERLRRLDALGADLSKAIDSSLAQRATAKRAEKKSRELQIASPSRASEDRRVSLQVRVPLSLVAMLDAQAEQLKHLFPGRTWTRAEALRFLLTSELSGEIEGLERRDAAS